MCNALNRTALPKIANRTDTRTGTSKHVLFASQVGSLALTAKILNELS
jgi:hypothetical protein